MSRIIDVAVRISIFVIGVCLAWIGIDDLVQATNWLDGSKHFVVVLAGFVMITLSMALGADDE